MQLRLPLRALSIERPGLRLKWNRLAAGSQWLCGIDTLRCHVIFPCRLHVARRLKNWHCVIHPYPEFSLQCMFLAQTEAEARGQQVIGNLSRVGGIRSSEVESCGSFVTSALRLPLSEPVQRSTIDLTLRSCSATTSVISRRSLVHTCMYYTSLFSFRSPPQTTGLLSIPMSGRTTSPGYSL